MPKKKEKKKETKKEEVSNILGDISEVLISFDERISNLETRVENLESTMIVAGPEVAKLIYSDEEGYKIFHGGYYGEYVIVTPEKEEYHYGSMKSAEEALEYLKKSKK
jgi:hypothetical protein